MSINEQTEHALRGMRFTPPQRSLLIRRSLVDLLILPLSLALKEPRYQSLFTQRVARGLSRSSHQHDPHRVLTAQRAILLNAFTGKSRYWANITGE